MTARGLVADCPAKINLMLRVLGPREDGYHELRTVYQAIDLWDRLELWPDTHLSLDCGDARLPSDASNLVLRAALLLRSRHGRSGDGGRLKLTKSIPVEAGLGGGSSNAAAALLLCAKAWGLAVDRRRLAELGQELGSDVPFFLWGGRAAGTGRGEIIRPLASAATLHLLIGCPPFGIPTRTVYERLRARLTPPENGVSLPVLSSLKWPQENDFGFVANDLEAVVFEGWPELVSFRDALFAAGAGQALLSGSGAAVYGIFDGPGKVEGALSKLRGRFARWRLLPTRGIEGGVRIRAAARAETER